MKPSLYTNSKCKTRLTGYDGIASTQHVVRSRKLVVLPGFSDFSIGSFRGQLYSENYAFLVKFNAFSKGVFRVF